MDLAGQLANGGNLLSVWLEDNVGNSDPATAATVSLRYDDIPPASTASSPATSSARPIPVSFSAQDPGADSIPQTGSGASAVNLWVSRDANDDGLYGPWSLAASTPPTGSFAYDPGTQDGNLRFYTQAVDAAGNVEPPPVSTTPAKAEALFDATPPAISDVRLPVVGFAQAQVFWRSDDRATGIVEYGTTTALGDSRLVPLGREHLAVLDCALFSPATVYYRITSTNRAGLSAATALASFVTPPQVTTPVDIFGVVDPSKPIDVQVTNPDILSGSYSIDGQSGTVFFSTSTGFRIYLDTSTLSDGLQTLRIVLNGFTYETQFIVDSATRSVRLARAVIDAAGVITDSAATPGSSVAELTLGEPAQESMSGSGSRLQLGFYAAIDPLAPAPIADLAASAGPGAGQVSLRWTAVGDDASVGAAMTYDLRRSTSAIASELDFAAAVPVALSTYPALAGTLQGAIVSGLADGATCYFALKAVDDLLNASPFSGGVMAKTLEVAHSADLTAGLPTVEFLSAVFGVSVTRVSTTTTAPAVALATSAAAAQGLLFYSALYDVVSPDPGLPGGATIQFRYLDPGDPALEAGLRVYEFKSALSQWVLIADVGPDAARDLFFLPIPGLSFYAVMSRDATPPLTALEPRGGRLFASPSGTLFASTGAVFGLSARDPPHGGFSGSGVARSEFRVDSPNGPFQALPSSSSFILAPGLHAVQLRSVDRAGNVEPVRGAVVAVDAAAPAAALSADAPSVAAVDGLRILSASATLNVTLQDPLVLAGAPGAGSGVASASWSLDGGARVSTSEGFVVFLASGTHRLAVSASDRVGNALDASFLIVVGDALPPRTTAQFGAPSAGTDPVYVTSATPIVLRSVDDLLSPGDGAGLGVAFQEASLTSLSSGTARAARFTAPVSTFTASGEADGLYALSFFAEDAAGNREAVRRATVAVDNTSPRTALAVSGPSFVGARLFVSTRTGLGFSAEDPVIAGAASGVERTLYALDGDAPALFSGAFSLAGGTHSVVFQSLDRLGNAEAQSARVLAVDADAPRTGISFIGSAVAASSRSVPADVFAFLAGGSAVVLSAEETGSSATASGIALTRRRLDGGAFEVSGGAFGVGAQGLHLLEFQSLDHVDNEEPARFARVAVDTTPPSISLAVHGSSFSLGPTLFVSSSSALELSAEDPVAGGVAAGAQGVEFRLDASSAAPFELFAASFSLLAGAHRIELRGRDRVGNESEVLAREVVVDTAAPVSALVVGQPRADLGEGVLLVAPGTPLSIASSDSGAGVREALVSVDGGAFAASAGTFTLAGEGARLVRFFARDNVLNAEAVRSSSFVVDATPPSAYLLSPSPQAAGVDQAFAAGLVPIAATISDLHLSSYALEFAFGVDAQSGFALVATGTAPVARDVIALWDASALSGFYTLRLSARDALGAAAVSTATVYIGDPQAVLLIRNQEESEKDKLLDKPEGVAVGPDGSILVGNTGKDQVLKFGPQGNLLAAFNGETPLVPKGKKGPGKDERGPSETITFKQPKGLAVDESGVVFVADRGNDRIVVLSSAGVVLRSLGRTNPQGRFIPGHGPSEFNKPSGVAVSPSRVVVADRGNGRVQVFDRGFAFLFEIKLAQAVPVPTGGDEQDDDEDDDEDEEEAEPFAVAWGPDGLLYVSDDENARVLVFDAQGAPLASLGRFQSPKGVAASPLSYLYAADRGGRRVRKFDPLRNEDPAMGASLGLEQPTGVALDGAGFLYLTDRTGDRVLKLGLPAPPVVVVAPPQDGGKVRKGRLAREGGKLARADRVAVEVPPGALAQELELSIEPEKDADPDEGARKRLAKERKLLAAVSEGVEYGPAGTLFNAPVTISLVYDPEALPAGGRPEDLKVHYWDPAKAQWEPFPSTVDKGLRTVSAKTMHFSLYQVLAPAAVVPLAADPSFSLKAAYAFPNPARGHRAVTIRIQPGLADSLSVRVYDVTGRKVHESSSFIDRGAFDDGNGLGPQFTYDHLWDVAGVGSGVYAYVVVARKAGQTDIRKTGRIGVVK